MGLEVSLARKAAATHGTPEGPLIKVGGLVLLAGASVSEDLTAVLAFKRPFSRVNVHVISKRPLVRELFPTQIAQNRLLPYGM